MTAVRINRLFGAFRTRHHLRSLEWDATFGVVRSPEGRLIWSEAEVVAARIEPRHVWTLSEVSDVSLALRALPGWRPGSAGLMVTTRPWSRIRDSRRVCWTADGL